MPKSRKPSSSNSGARKSGQPGWTLRWQLLRQDLGEGGARLCLALAVLLVAALVCWALAPGWGWRCGGCAALLALLLFTARRWMPGPGSAHPDDADAPSSKSSATQEPFVPGNLSAAQWTRLILRLGLLTALVIAGYERYPRLEQSLAPHEERLLPAIHGTWTQKEDRQIFEETPWSATLFDMGRLGASTGIGPLAAALDRLALEAWRESKSLTPEAFSEVPLRLPAFLAGLLTLAVVLYLGQSMSAPWAGLAGAILLALHPGTLRLGSEASGEGLMLLMWLLYMAALHKARNHPTLSAWLKVTLSGVACVLCQNWGFAPVLAGFLWALERPLRRGEFRQVATLAAFACLGVLPIWFVMGPDCGAWLSGSGLAEPSSAPSLATDFLSRWLIAVPGANPFPKDHLGIQWTAWISHPGGLVLAWVLPILTIAGIGRARWQEGAASLFVASPILAGLLASLGREISPAERWATLALLPLALGAPLIVQFLFKKPRWLAPVAIAAIVITYGAATREVSQRLRDHDLKPTKDLVEFIHRQDTSSLTASFGAEAGVPILSYDPGLHVITQVKELTNLVETAVHEHRSLFVYIAGEHEAAQQFPELDKALQHGCPTSLANGWTARFQALTPFWGVQEKWTYQIYRLANAREVSQP